MKKNVSPLAVVAALVLVGLMIYGVFQALTQTGSTANPEYANRIPEYARERGMVGSSPGGSSNNNTQSNQPAAGTNPAASNSTVGTSSATSTPR